jgi:acetyltransferase EpsM
MKVLILGFGGNAKVVIDLCNELGIEIIAIYDDNLINKGSKYMNIEICGPIDDLCNKEIKNTENNIVIPIGNIDVRRKLYDKFTKLGFNFPNIVSPQAKIAKTAKIGIGNIIYSNAIINSCATLGDFNLVNTASIIEHDCVIGNFNNICPNVTICGTCNFGNNNFVGASTVVRNNINVGHNNIIGCGTIIVKNIENNKKGYGNPFKIVEELSPILETIATNAMELQKTDPLSTNIEQIYIAEHLRLYWEKDILENTLLKSYSDSNKPTFFYGCYSPNDLKILQDHNSYAIVIWTGGDCNPKTVNVLSNFKIIKSQKKVFHIAISQFIAETLKNYELKYTFKPFYAFKINNFQACVKGPAIYVYYGNGDDNVYGINCIEEIKKNFPTTEFICTTSKISYETLKKKYSFIKCYEKYDLPMIYSKCFIGLRLTPHDGLSGTVQEMGCMGIKSVWNGGTPSALSYKNTQDIIKHIRNERLTIGLIDNETSKRTKDYLTITQDFYKLNNYL